MAGGRLAAWVVLVSLGGVLGCIPESRRVSRPTAVPAYRATTFAPASGAVAMPSNGVLRNGTAYSLWGEFPAGLPAAWAGLFGAPTGAAPASAVPTGFALPRLSQLPLDPKALPIPPGLALPPGFTFPGLPGAPPAPGAKPAVPSAPGSTVKPGTIALTPLEQELLAETNLRRSQGATCAPGNKYFPPTSPLVIHDGLQKTAREHSEDMARRNYFEHANPEGEGPGPRGRRHGYNGVFTGENIEMGAHSAREAVDGWMSSLDGHCMNIMDERYHYFGGAYAVGSSTYWTQNFGP